MKILILGGDGYLGWPTAMHLSAKGHEVMVVDNYLRRKLAGEEDVEPLHQVPNLHERARVWKAHSGYEVYVRIGDLRQREFMNRMVEDFRPDSVVHYAEQPSAPYSMLSHAAAELTLHNNVGVTLNLVYAVREYAPNAHIVKLGTMGEYGTPDIDIEEGWIDINHKGKSDRFLFPRQAGSLYHTTKIMDTDLLWYYVRVWGLSVTDLMQGPVYGIYTDENEGDERLVPHFSYDELFGTVLNRFIVQSVVGHPLTVYGKGEQTRGYLNLKDTLQCVALSVENPAPAGELRIFNQFTETFSVNELAERVVEAAHALAIEVEVKPLSNPRKEKEEHYYNPAHTGLLDLGLNPTYLTVDVLSEMLRYVVRHKDNICDHKIFRGTKWV